MSALTDEKFESVLDNDLAWRRIELHSLSSQLASHASANKSSPATRALARSMVTLLYAHWEGYSKCVFEHYATLIVRRKPVATETNDALLRTHTTHLLKRLESGDGEARDELLAMARGTGRPRLRLAKTALSDTKANLRFGVLTSILQGFGISASDFETKQRLIDVLLCDRRNEVAHGRDNFPNPDDVLELHHDVIFLMERVHENVISQVRAKGYLRAV